MQGSTSSVHVGTYLPRVDHVENRWEPRGDPVGTRRVWFPPGPHVVATWSPRGTHAQVAHSPQPRHSVLQLAASCHHIAMGGKRDAEGAALKEAAKKKAKDDKDNASVPVAKPVGWERQAVAASPAAVSGAGAAAG